MISSSFWSGKRVFLTGHTGFKGSWLSLWLKQLGADVTGFSLPPPTSPNVFELASVDKSVQSYEGDIRDLNALRKCIQKTEPDLLFHLAAQPLVRLSYREPVETFATNVMGTVNFLEALRSVPNAKAAVVVTTDKCYENREWPWAYREIEPMGGHDPYSSSKGCAELVTSSYRRSFFTNPNGTKVGSARAGNVIGGGDFSEDRLIPDIVRAIQSKGSLEIRNPKATRPWQHVLEPLSGYLMLAERLASEDGMSFAEGWNFGPVDADAWPVQKVVDTFIMSIQQDWLSPKYGVPSDLHEANWLKLDISKAAQKLLWYPQLPLKTGLTWTSEWYAAALSGQDMRDFTLQQINAYQQVRSKYL